MLTSVAANGNVDEAAILVAAFDLDEAQKEALRVGAGKLSRRMKFIDVTPVMLQGVDSNTLKAYPPAALGRLMLADYIPETDARLLTLDSDMIVNVSLRPLFELDLGEEYFAACHDPPRADDPTYFNSGLTLIEVAEYRRHDIGRRSVQYVAQHHPYFADQDALNVIVGQNWHKLEPSWNFFRLPDRIITAEDYESANIAHFPAWKPWDHADHPGVQLYNHYLDQYRSRLAAAK